MPNWTLHQGECLDVLKNLPDNSVDSVVTDPPYGLSNYDAGDVREALRCWLDGKPYTPKGSGFMGKGWDAFVPGPEVWSECLRVLKPGGHLLVFAGTRTQDLMGIAVRLAGFDARDTVIVQGMLHWTYGCLSEDTEILVDGGWEPYHEAIEGRRALCYDAENDVFTWQPIQQRFVYPFNGNAYRIWSDSTDQVVTPNHRCLVLREGQWEFAHAETITKGATVPTVENLHGLLAALPVPQHGTMARKEGLRSEVPSGTDLPCSEVSPQDPSRGVQGQGTTDLHGLSKTVLALQGVATTHQRSCLLQEVWGGHARPGACQTLPQGSHCLDGCLTGIFSEENVRPQQPRVEGRGDDLQDPRELRGREVCAVSHGIPAHGPQGRLRHGAPSDRGDGAGTVSVTDRNGASHQPRPHGQPSGEFGPVRVEPGSQAVRASRFTIADLARIEPVHYTGIVWCVRVPTGAFVARRNGKVFVTGNSGFPKSLDVSKAIDKAAGAERSRTPRVRSDGKATGKVVTGFDAFDLDATTQYGPPITDAAKQWDGWGTALKPSQEPVLVFRKPLDGTVAYNVLKYGTGGINIDGCRLASQSGTGRWPTNTVFCHTPECVRVGTVKSNNAVLKNTVEGELLTSYGGGLKQRPHGEDGYADEDGTETVDRWECVDGCPVAVLDAQSGECPGMKPHRLLRGATTGAGVGYGKGAPQDAGVIGRGDTGTASRFFPQFAADDPDAPFRYIAKPSRAEKNAGCEGLPQTAGASVAKVAGGKVMRCGECSRTHPMTHRGPCARCGSDAVEVDDAADDGSGRDGCRVRGNHHPTVKPIALMRWLARLVTPTNGVVLDPFNGSGTTGCAAVLEGFQYIGIEREPEYVEIARARIAHHERVVQGGVKNPWTENPVTENPTAEATETTPTTLDDLFGF